MEQLINFINKFTPLDNEVINELEKRVEFETFTKNTFILKEGAKANKVWFITSGLVRKFYIEDGKEITTWIHSENEMFTSMHSYFNQKPSGEYLQAIENTELISLSYLNSQELSKYPQMQIFGNNLITKQFACIDEFSKKFSLMNAKEKYDALSEVAPQIIKRAKLGYIASIMGISQETLSRIRSKN